LVCNGALLRVSDFPELFSVVGNSYGGGDSHFRLPDLTSCEPFVGAQFRYLINTAPSPNGPTGTLMLSL
jgi:microcystin-dependent protein